MKRLLLFPILLLIKFASAQDTPFTYNEVVKVDSVSKPKLYAQAKKWIDSTYASPQKVIQLDDKENATVLIKAAFVVHVTDGMERDGGVVEYSLNVQCRDGRYKIALSDFIHHHGTSDLGDGGDLNKTRPACSPLNLPKYYWHQIKEQATERRNNLIASLKNTLGSNPQKPEKSDW